MSVAFEIPNFYIGVLPANSDLSLESADQFAAVQAVPGSGGLGAVDLPSAGGPILGILQNNPIAGEAAQVMAQGVSKAKLAGTVAAGNLLMCDATGKLLLATTGNQAVAYALQAGVSGDIVGVFLKSFGKV